MLPRYHFRTQFVHEHCFSEMFFGHSSDTLWTRAYAAVMTRRCNINHNSSKRKSKRSSLRLRSSAAHCRNPKACGFKSLFNKSRFHPTPGRFTPPVPPPTPRFPKIKILLLLQAASQNQVVSICCSNGCNLLRLVLASALEWSLNTPHNLFKSGLVVGSRGT